MVVGAGTEGKLAVKSARLELCRPFAAVYRGLNEMERNSTMRFSFWDMWLMLVVPCFSEEHFDASGQISSQTIEEFLKEEYVPVTQLLEQIVWPEIEIYQLADT